MFEWKMSQEAFTTLTDSVTRTARDVCIIDVIWVKD
jgi:hypothetical protein